MSTTAEKKKLEGVFALWKRTSEGGKTYFTGITEDKKTSLTAFYNTKKKNLKEPDLRVYTKDEDGNLSKEEFVSLWCNATKNGKKVLSGKLDGKRLVGFIKEDETGKRPYISVYFEEEKLPEVPEEKKPEPKPEKKSKYTKGKKEPKFEEIEPDDDLPF